MANATSFSLVVALDIGTTFSGYAFSLDGNRIHMNPNWGHGTNAQTYKTPTSVLMGPNREFVSMGYDAERQYNSHLEEGTKGYHLYQHFKMKLYGVSKLTRKTQIVSQTGQKMAALDIFAVFIKALTDHCLEQVHRSLETTIPKAEIRWVVTVPAIWSEQAKKFMRQAVHKAGLIPTVDSHSLVLALEPEAATLHCRREFSTENKTHRKGQVSLKVGDKYVIIDAGGGTVDITAHEVIDDSLAVKEIVEANGGPWGGNEINKKFVETLQTNFNELFWKQVDKRIPLQIYNMLSQFEANKKYFRATDEGFKLSLEVEWAFANFCKEFFNEEDLDRILATPNLKPWMTFNRTNGRLIIAHSTLHKICKEIVDKIENHVKELLKTPVLRDISYVFMVGGFAMFPMLQDVLRKLLPPNCQLIVPEMPQIAILKGAVHFGFNTKEIQSRIIRKTFGSDLMILFDPRKHDADLKSTYDGIDYCDGVFEPFVFKGDEVTEGQIFQTRKTTVMQNQSHMTIDIISTDKTDFKNTDFVNKPYMETIGSLILKFPTLREFREVLVKFKFGGTEIEVTAEDEASGEKVETSVDFVT